MDGSRIKNLSSFAENLRLLSLGMNAPVAAVRAVALKGFLLRRDFAPAGEWKLRALARRASFSLVVFSILLALALFPEGAYSVSVGYDEFDYWEGTQVVRVCRRYDSEGRLRQKVFYWKDGVTPQQDEKYDLAGNPVEKIHYNSSGRMQANIDGWAAMRAKYNNKTPMVESFYGEDGKIVARKLYNESGRLVVRQMMGDQDFDPYEQFEAQPVMGERVLYYDRSGQLKGAVGGNRQD